MSDITKIRHCSYLLPDPGGEVVRELCDEIEQLRSARDEARAFIVAEYNKFYDYHPWAHELRARYPWLAALAAEKEV